MMANQPPGVWCFFWKRKNFYEIFSLIVLVHRTEEIPGQLSAPCPLSWKMQKDSKSPINERVVVSVSEATEQRLCGAAPEGLVCARARAYRSVSRGGGEGRDCVWVYGRRQREGGMACTYRGRGQASPAVPQGTPIGQLFYLSPSTGALWQPCCTEGTQID